MPACRLTGDQLVSSSPVAYFVPLRLIACCVRHAVDLQSFGKITIPAGSVKHCIPHLVASLRIKDNPLLACRADARFMNAAFR